MDRDYREKDIDGMIFDGYKLRRSKVTVRTTSDKYGKSLSLTVANIQIQIPLESVAEIIKLVEKK